MNLPIGTGSPNAYAPEKSAARKAASSMLSFLLASPPYLPNEIKSKDVNRRHNILSLNPDDSEDYLVTDCYPSPKGHTPSRAIELLHRLTEKVEQLGSSHYTDESSPLMTNIRFRTPESECILAAVDLGDDKEEETFLTLIMRLEGDEDNSKDYKFDNILPSDVVPEGWHESIQKAQESFENSKNNHLNVQKARSYSIVTTSSTVRTVDSAYSTASAGRQSEGDDDTSERDESLDNDVSFDDNFVRRGSTQSGVKDDGHTDGKQQKDNNLPWPSKPEMENEKNSAEYYTDPKDFWAGTGDDDDEQNGDEESEESEHEESEEDRQRREEEEEERYWAMYGNQDSGHDNQTKDSNHHNEDQQRADMLAGLVQNLDNFNFIGDDHERSEHSHEEHNHNQFEEQQRSYDTDQNAMLINSTDTRYGEDLGEERAIRPKFNKSNSFIASQLEGSESGKWNDEQEPQSDQSERGSNNDHDTVTGHRERMRSNQSQFDKNVGEEEINQEDALMHINGGQHSHINSEYMDDGDPQEVHDSIQPLGGYRDRNSSIFSPPSPSLHPSDTFLADNASDASLSVMRSTIQERQKPRSSMLFQLRSSKNNNSNGKRNGKETTAMKIEKMRNYRPTREATITTQQAHKESVRIGQRQRDYAVKIKNRNESIKMIIKGAWKLMDERSSSNISDDSNGDSGLERMNENDFLRLAREAVRECVDERQI
ncbi:hypothetical protein L7F22_043827 [Adiantum nelumboides]|nr:hypothetical protein [Adiantum nelumboides]